MALYTFFAVEPHNNPEDKKMTLEELQAKVDELSAGNEALAAKNRELLGEVKTLKVKAKGADIDPEQFVQLQQDNEHLKAELEKATKLSKTEIEKLTTTLSAKDSALQNYLVDGGLTEALAKANIKTGLIGAAKALLKGQVQITDADGNYQASINGKPIADAINEWAATDEGKNFVNAPVNSGGGAVGGGVGGHQTGNLGGDKSDRLNAIKSKFPELAA